MKTQRVYFGSSARHSNRSKDDPIPQTPTVNPAL